MQALIGVAGTIAVAAITPGPNNLVVMRVAARAGVAGALPAIIAILLGSFALLTVVATGVGAMIEVQPFTAVALGVCGSGYLGWMGALLAVRGSSAQASSAPDRAVWLFGFQFVNVKAWMMVIAATSAARASLEPSTAFLLLATLFAFIPAVCLLLWSCLGALLTRYLERAGFRLWFDRAMGALLVTFAVMLLP